MYKPTEEELLGMGFQKRTLFYILKNLVYQDDGQWILYDTIHPYYFFPESIEDIKTLIRLFKLSS